MGKNPNNYTHIFKYTGVFGGIQGLNILVGLVRNKLVALLLGPQGMGLVALFNSSVKLLNDSTNLGLPMSAVRKIADATGALVVLAHGTGGHVAMLLLEHDAGCVDLFLGKPRMALCLSLAPGRTDGCDGW